MQQISTVVDFTTVDVSPSFVACDSLIDFEKRACFRKQIHQQLTNELAKHTIKVAHSIDETIYIDLLISSNGKISLLKNHLSKTIQKEVPKLDSLLKVSIAKLPKLRPAIKRGIPVTTQYQLPIRFYNE